MTQEEFDNAPLLDQILYDTTGLLVKNHPGIKEAMENYLEAKLKLLNLHCVDSQRELLKAVVTEFDNGEITWETRDSIEILLKSP